MPTRQTHIVDPIIRRLRALAQEAPGLKDAALVYEAILPLLRNADLRVGTVPLTPEQAREKMEKGLPLLHDLNLELDVEAARSLMIKLAAAVENVDRKHQPRKLRLPWLSSSREPGTAAGRIRLALEENRLDPGVLLPHVAAGDAGPVSSAARDLELDPALLLTLAKNALKPALRAWRGQLDPLVKGVPWRKGVCFVCGAAATLAELQENDQVRHLRCGSCGADWRFHRLECIYCGNEDHKTQKYLYAEGQRERMRIEVCDRCRGYLKVVSSFTPSNVEMLAIEDLATLHLDAIAEERGYARAGAGAGTHPP